MIRFSTRSEYGLRMMAELARHYGDGPLPLSEIALHEGISAMYLEQLAGKLRKAGLVISHQGAHGGYELAAAPIDTCVGTVLRALEGPISPMFCATEGATEMQCERQSFCSVNPVWERVRDAVAQTLDSMTLEDLVPYRNGAPSGTTDLLTLTSFHDSNATVGRATTHA
jgi:Rrf2 family transcriptional regulator, cysteine metabolism repressor